MSWPYAWLAKVKRWCYLTGWFTQRKLSKPVISVGNLTVGGTGKTPFVIWFANWAKRRGVNVAVLSRGFGRQSSSRFVLVSDGSPQVSDWRMVGDEPALIAQKCPGTYVAVGDDRYELGRWLLTQADCDCFLLDDGFQHVSLFRDLDVVVFDSTDLEGLCGVLPFGRLREPLDAASIAQGIVLTRLEDSQDSPKFQPYLQECLGRDIRPMKMRTRYSHLVHVSTGVHQDIISLTETRVVLFSGIGNPGAFRKNVETLGCQIVKELRFPDHFAYSMEDVLRIRTCMKETSAQMVLTTEKDGVRLQAFLQDQDPVWALEMELEMLSDPAILDELVEPVLGLLPKRPEQTMKG